MKRIWFLALLAAGMAQSAVSGEEKKIKLDSTTTLVLTVSSNLEVREFPGSKSGNVAVAITDKQGKSEMRLFVMKTARQVPLEEVKQQTIAAARKTVLPNAVEKEIVTRELKGKSCQFFYFQLTDARKDPGDGRYMTEGAGVDSYQLAQFMIISKEKTKAEQEMLDCLAGMTLEKVE